MFKYGDKVRIKDGSGLHGSVGMVYQKKEGRIYILLDREVVWPVAEEFLEIVPAALPNAVSAL